MYSIGNKNHAFNDIVSQKIGMYRILPDTRNKLCDKERFDLNELPLVSIIICFHNEANSTLLRTIATILRMTPNLKEIILIDDFSTMDHLKAPLQLYVDKHSKLIRLLRMTEREGLIRARVIGAKLATAEVLVFLDSHVEVNVNWLPPLLEIIHKDKSTVAIPYIDLIDPNTFKYTASPRVKGGFNWGLFFRWDKLPIPDTDKEIIAPIDTPTMSGGLFAVNKAYFEKLGYYDGGMEIWGSENLELSFRTWQCGGRLQICPCSRVGHVYRSRRPYGNGGRVIDGVNPTTRNQLRLANVWMDDYKENFFKVNPSVRNLPFGDISERVDLRKKLKCKSFKWYLNNIYPDLLPAKSNIHSHIYSEVGKLKHVASGLCITSQLGIYDKMSNLILSKCTNDKSMIWYLTKDNRLLLGKVLCMTSISNNIKITLNKCIYDSNAREQLWLYNNNKKTFQNEKSRKCLKARNNNVESKSYITIQRRCSDEYIFIK